MRISCQPSHAHGVLIVAVVAFLLLLVGMEVALERWRGRFLVLVGSAFLLLLGLTVLVGFGQYLAAQGVSLMLIAIATHHTRYRVRMQSDRCIDTRSRDKSAARWNTESEAQQWI